MSVFTAKHISFRKEWSVLRKEGITVCNQIHDRHQHMHTLNTHEHNTYWHTEAHNMHPHSWIHMSTSLLGLSLLWCEWQNLSSPLPFLSRKLTFPTTCRVKNCSKDQNWNHNNKQKTMLPKQKQKQTKIRIFSSRSVLGELRKAQVTIIFSVREVHTSLRLVPVLFVWVDFHLRSAGNLTDMTGWFHSVQTSPPPILRM